MVRVSMFNFFSIISLGFFLGMRHATDPDHVIAVTTIISRRRGIWRSAWIGIFWGMGHTLTILLVGAAIILFNLVIPPRVGLSMELAVGIMLVVLGLINVRAFLRPDPGLSQPSGEGPGPVAAEAQPVGHTHSKARVAEAPLAAAVCEPGHARRHPSVSLMDRVLGPARLYQHLRPLMIGVVHGLAGSAAIALLVLATIRNPYWGIAYLLVFGVGTIAGMMLITMSLASTLHLVGESRRLARMLTAAAGALSLAFGLAVAYHIGFVDGLFTGHPNWTPH